MKKPNLQLLIYAMLFLFITSCETDNIQVAGLNVNMTTKSGTYDAVNVSIKNILVHTQAGGWIDMPIKAGIYNLQDIQNQITILGSTNVPSSNVLIVKIEFGAINTVTKNAMTYNLIIPSENKKGYEFKVHQMLDPGTSNIMTISFNIDQSVKPQSGGKYKWVPDVDISFE